MCLLFWILHNRRKSIYKSDIANFNCNAPKLVCLYLRAYLARRHLCLKSQTKNSKVSTNSVKATNYRMALFTKASIRVNRALLVCGYRLREKMGELKSIRILIRPVYKLFRLQIPKKKICTKAKIWKVRCDYFAKLISAQ